MGDIRVEIRPASDQAAQRLEYSVFLEAGYIDSNPEQTVLEYTKYSKSEFVVALDGEKLTGIVRLIYASDETSSRGLPTLEKFEIYKNWREKISNMPTRKLGEYGTLAVLKEFRGGRTTYLLKRKLILHPALKGYRYGVSLIDEGLLNKLVSSGYPLEQIGEKKHFMGSVTVPVLANFYNLHSTFGIWIKQYFIPIKQSNR